MELLLKTDVFVQQIFSQQVKLFSSNLFSLLFFCYYIGKKVHEYIFSNVSLDDNSCRKKCTMEKLSWNNEKLSSRPEVFCNGKRCSWKFRKIHTPLPESRFWVKLQTERLQLYWKETPVQGILVNFAKFSRASLSQKTTHKMTQEYL